MKVGVIGAGGMGARHARNIANRVTGATVSVLMDVDRDRAREVAEQVGAAVEEDASAVISSPDVDVVVIASPDPTHASLAIACLEAAKPVLVEKPLGISADEAHQVVRAELAAGKRLVQVGLMREFDPQHIAVRRSIVAGEIGRPLAFRGWHRNPPQDPRPTTRHIVFSSAVHDIHSARWLLGSDPVRVFATGSSIDAEANPALELQLITLEMANGSIATIEVNADSGFGYEVGVEVVGSEGTVTVAPQHTPFVRRGTGVTQPMDSNWLERFETAYVDEVRAWVEAVRSVKPIGASAWDGYVSLLAADAVLASLESRQPVEVAVPPRPLLYSDGT